MGELIRAVVPKGTTWEESYDLIAPCYEEYANSNTGSTKPYDGVLDLLKTLQKEGVKVAVISNKPEQTAIDLCKTALDDCVSVVLGAKDEIKGLPAPDLIFAAAKELDVPLFKVLAVGNTKADVQAARNAGVDGVAVSWGFKSRTALENQSAKVIVDTPAELLELI